MIRLFLFCNFLSFMHVGFCQQKCGTVENTRKLRSLNIHRESEDDFEHWMNLKLIERNQAVSAGRKKSNHYRIPVVFHVIHEGEPIGMGTNISDEQIYSQLNVLNEDFQRKNADAVNTPSDFRSVAGSMDIEFVLARRTPDGNYTTGINRIQNWRTSWTSFDEFELKALSYWPAEDYLNIWVCDITDFLGLGQYPVSDLPGLAGIHRIRETDGIIVQTWAFGSDDHGNFVLDPQYNKGRTLPHEAGHFMGLHHIWGESGGCEGSGSSDYVDDTPVQATSTAGCPSHPQRTCDPPVTSMFQNFMEYTNDVCMNLFTKGQMARMEIVLENSPRRKSLLTSPGLLYPGPTANDLALLQLPVLAPCTNTLTPSLWVKNVGTNNITRAEVTLNMAGQHVETMSFSLSLPPLDSVEITFTPLTFAEGVADLEFKVLSTNGLEDTNFLNNIEQTKLVADWAEDIVPYRQDFQSVSLPGWTLIPAYGGVQWETTPDQSSDVALRLRLYNNVPTPDASWLISPQLDFSNAQQVFLSYDLAFTHPQESNDHLSVLVRECSSEFEEVARHYPEIRIPRPTLNFRDDIQKHLIDLSAYAGNSAVRVGFLGKNHSGSSLYIDNIELYKDRDPRLISIAESYSIFGYDWNGSNVPLKIGFNLEERQHVQCEIFTTIGQRISVIEWFNVLNQVYELPYSDRMNAGTYVVRLQIGGQYSSKLILKNY